MNRQTFLQRLGLSLGNVIVIAIFCYLVFLIGSVIWRNYQNNQTIAKMEDNLTVTQLENGLRKELLVYYQSDNYKEVELRRRLMLQKPGEKVVMLPIRKNDTNDPFNDLVNTVAPTQTTPPNQTPNVVKWVNLFFGQTSPFR